VGRLFGGLIGVRKMNTQKILSEIEAERKEAKEKASKDLDIASDSVARDILFFNTGVMVGLGMAQRIIRAEESKGNIMAKSKFTPGPWVAEPRKDCGIFRIKAGEENIASLSFWNEPNENANAELMADAPRLLEVLRKVLEYSDMKTSWLTIDEAEQAFDDANELVEKHGG
jgi:hypothetical protein